MFGRQAEIRKGSADGAGSSGGGSLHSWLSEFKLRCQLVAEWALLRFHGYPRAIDLLPTSSRLWKTVLALPQRSTGPHSLRSVLASEQAIPLRNMSSKSLGALAQQLEHSRVALDYIKSRRQLTYWPWPLSWHHLGLATVAIKTAPRQVWRLKRLLASGTRTPACRQTGRDKPSSNRPCCQLTITRTYRVITAI
ncbi:hypothetical protein LX36DRAFT_102131 [Colletotrichum falcatum]|nr:hypothetical protein LX36DRAFT_102131 [Colletotrichum falcatum]